MAADYTSMKDRLFVAPCFHLPDPDFDKVSERLTVNLVTAIINIIASVSVRSDTQFFNWFWHLRHFSFTNALKTFHRMPGSL